MNALHEITAPRLLDFDYTEAARLANEVQTFCNVAANLRQSGHRHLAANAERTAIRAFRRLADELNHETKEIVA